MMEIYLDELTQSVPDEFDHSFKYIETIASGSFGTVIRAIQLETNQEVAVKVINKDRTKHNHIHKLKQEVNILKQLTHQNIVEFLGFVETNNKLYIIMEYVHQGTLKSLIDKRLGNITEEEASKIIERLLSAVEYLHCREICHRDIKPENIMFHDTTDLNTLKLIDFGLSAQYFEALEEFEICGTLLYMAPEQIEKRTYSKAIDIWSVGIILFMLLNQGKHPFYRKGDRRPTYKHKLKTSKLTLFYKCSEMAQMLLYKLLDSNPSSRYTAEKALKHPWVTRRIYDNIPQTLFETIRTNQIIKKVKTAFGAILFLSKFSKKNLKYCVDSMPQEYILRVEQMCDIQKNNFKKKREKSFEIWNSEEKEKNNFGHETINISGIDDTMMSQVISVKNLDVKKSLKLQFNMTPCSTISPRILQKEDLVQASVKISPAKDEEKRKETKKKVIEFKNPNWGNVKTLRIKDKDKDKERFPVIKEPSEQILLNLNSRTSKAISISPVRRNHVTDEKFTIELKRADQASNGPDSCAKCSNIQKNNVVCSKMLALEARKKAAVSISPKKVKTIFENPMQSIRVELLNNLVEKYSQVCIVGPMTKDNSSTNLSGSNGTNPPLVLPTISYPHSTPSKMKKKKELQILLSQF